MRFFLFFILLISVSCSSVKNNSAIIEEQKSVKIDIVFEKELKGNHFGLSLYKPFGIATDFQGNIFVVDGGNNRILKYDSLLNPIRQIGGFGSSEGLFNNPTFISFDNGLNLMVSDEKNNRIVRFNSQLEYVDEISFFDDEDPLKFGYPSGVTFTNYGEVWIADRDNNQIAIMNNIGQYSHSLGQFGASGGQLKSPEKLIKDTNGDFLICDAGNKRILRYDEYGGYLTEYDSDFFEYPVSVSLYKSYIVVLDEDLSSLLFFTQNGKYLGEVNSQFLGDKKKLLNPSDFVFLSQNKILISDTGNNRLVLGKLIIEE